jgi:hypothetical protein
MGFRALLTPLLAIAALSALSAAPTSAQAEIKKMMASYPGKLCAWFQSTVTPPKGWAVDDEAGKTNLVTILLPHKPKLTFSDPMIYVQTAYRPDATAFDDIVASDLSILRKTSSARAKITPVGEAARSGGKPPFKLFLFENPDKPKQAVEKIAYGVEKLANGERYYLTVVDTAADRHAIEDSSAAYLEVLAGL